jgi:ATP phosphoribosyltransferase
MTRETIRLALPGKGRMAEETFAFLEKCGLRVWRPNERQYIATIPGHPGVEVILQRPGDIVIGVRQGSLDFGITGLDMVREKGHENGERLLILHEALGYGRCTLNLAVPNGLPLRTMADLRGWAAQRHAESGQVLRVATKFPRVSADFLTRHAITPCRLIDAEGTLEIAPTIGYADVIIDLVSSGITLRDNHLHPLEDGELLRSQAVLIANREALRSRPEVLAFARTLLEYIEAHLRGSESVLVIANMRGESAETIAARMFDHPALSGLRGPTIAPVYTRENDGHTWFSVSIVTHRNQLDQTITGLRETGGSGVIVTPALYIFEEEPPRYRAMLNAAGMDN